MSGFPFHLVNRKLIYYPRSPASSSVLLFLLRLHQRTPTGRTLTGRTVAELEVHTKKFYSPVEWKEISSGLWTSQKALSSVSSTSPTLERPYMDTYMKDSPSVRKHGNFWPCDMRSKRLKANIWGGLSTRCCPAGGLRYKTSKSKEQLLYCKRVNISTINKLEGSFSSLWSLKERKGHRSGRNLILRWERFKQPVNNRLLPEALSTCRLLCANTHKF